MYSRVSFAQLDDFNLIFCYFDSSVSTDANNCYDVTRIRHTLIHAPPAHRITKFEAHAAAYRT